jgi:hypothetical protein
MFYNSLNDIKKNTYNDVFVIIIAYNNNNFKIRKKSYNVNILGIPMIKWVKKAIGKLDFKIVFAKNEQDLFTLIKPHLTASSYTAVFFCDTPLLTNKTVLEVIDFAMLKQIDVCKLPRGYVINNEVIKNNKTNLNNQAYMFNEVDFMPALNLVALEKINSIMQQRINNDFQLNGVNIINSNSTIIESNVKIGKNVIIWPL